MNVIQRIPAVFRFELKRSFTIPRMAWWGILTLFPPALMILVRLTGGTPPSAETEMSATTVYILCAGVVCMMGVFLWATPAVTSELEGRSWVYLSVRPYGAYSVLLGKYLIAVAWTLPAGLIAATFSLLVLFPKDLWHLLWVQWLLVACSCFSYASVFILIGVLFPKRTMAFAVFYAILFEVVLASIPAVVNMFTVQFRLRNLLVRWMDWDAELARNATAYEAYFGGESAWWHFGVLVGMTAGYLLVAAVVLRFREFTSSAETEV